MQSPYVCYKYEMLQIDAKQKGKQNLTLLPNGRV